MQAWIPVSLTPGSISRRRCVALCWARTWQDALRRVAALACGADPAQQAVAQLVQLSGSAGEAAAACASAIRELGDGPLAHQLNAMACTVDPSFNEDVLFDEHGFWHSKGRNSRKARCCAPRSCSTMRAAPRGCWRFSWPSAWPPRSPATFPGRLPQPGRSRLPRPLRLVRSRACWSADARICRAWTLAAQCRRTSLRGPFPCSAWSASAPVPASCAHARRSSTHPGCVSAGGVGHGAACGAGAAAPYREPVRPLGGEGG